MFPHLIIHEHGVKAIRQVLHLGTNRLKEAELRVRGLWKSDLCEFALPFAPLARRLPEKADRVLPIDGRAELGEQVDTNAFEFTTTLARERSPLTSPSSPPTPSAWFLFCPCHPFCACPRRQRCVQHFDVPGGQESLFPRAKAFAMEIDARPSNASSSLAVLPRLPPRI